MFTPPVTREIARVARQQHGLISRAQLGALKISAKQIRGAVDMGFLEPVMPGVFRLTGAPATEEQSFAAATLWGGPDARASFRSVAALWGIDVPQGARPEITVPVTTNPRHDAVVVHRVGSPAEKRVRRGIPVTTPQRTIVDLAGVLAEPQLEIAFESARRERLLTVASVTREVERIGARGRSGTAALQALLGALADEPAAESALEVLVARLLRSTDLPKPQRQVDVTALGRRYRLDFAWPEHALALECDGERWHGDFERDRERWSAITGATGYRIVWATWRRVHDEPQPLLDELGLLINGRA